MIWKVKSCIINGASIKGIVSLPLELVPQKLTFCICNREQRKNWLNDLVKWELITNAINLLISGLIELFNSLFMQI